MKNKNWLKLASIYIGTVIGAGFASGQEIMQFFIVFGYKGLFGIILATFLFSILGSSVLLNVYRNKIDGYEKFLTPIFGKSLGKITEIIIIIFLLAGYCVMLAGSGAIFKEQFNISYNIGIYLMALVTLITFLFNIKGLSTVNTILVPILLLGVILTGGISILKNGFQISNFSGGEIAKTSHWIISSILYVSYNSITTVVIMSSLLPIISDKKTALKGGIFGGLGLGVLALFIGVPLLGYTTDINGLEVPMLKIAENLGNNGSLLYGIILWGAMFTTALSNGFGFIKRISSLLKVNQPIFSIIFCISAIPIARIGFTKLIITIYPLFGYLGFIIFVFIVGRFFIKEFKNYIKKIK
ncbi:hypothetical protein [Thermohalobacter berrensis]|uniref:Transporter n=1 Tax=Thermohalobacter berrensis TaxID=99594 RepID=A0A419T3L2_9FIRM|nr:hypothetical protein [Thermohalobacter berrensis]RKD32062.1 hypothetical protein BET03_11315 [Thermohalobacter berrensis]